MLPAERGPAARSGGAIAGPVAWCDRKGARRRWYGGRRCLTVPAAFDKAALSEHRQNLDWPSALGR